MRTLFQSTYTLGRCNLDNMLRALGMEFEVRALACLPFVAHLWEAVLADDAWRTPPQHRDSRTAALTTRKTLRASWCRCACQPPCPCVSSPFALYRPLTFRPFLISTKLLADGAQFHCNEALRECNRFRWATVRPIKRDHLQK